MGGGTKRARIDLQRFLHACHTGGGIRLDGVPQDARVVAILPSTQDTSFIDLLIASETFGLRESLDNAQLSVTYGADSGDA